MILNISTRNRAVDFDNARYVHGRGLCFYRNDEIVACYNCTERISSYVLDDLSDSDHVDMGALSANFIYFPPFAVLRTVGQNDTNDMFEADDVM